VVERPTTQNHISKAKMVPGKGLGDGNRQILHAILDWNGLTEDETSSPSNSPEYEFLLLIGLGSTSNNIIHAAYYLFD
jgi:hypothetical protein